MSDEDGLAEIKGDLEDLKKSLIKIESCINDIKTKFDFLDNNIVKIKNSILDTKNTFSSFVDDGLKNMTDTIDQDYSGLLNNLNFDLDKIKNIREALEKAKDKFSEK